ncbi:hypothetical protein PoB_005491200 [Plakobranchus ocellatus]|uniref:Uncharacterized protein n=1 Tax=Plakobranchus ocellatus TaxID=259542 RepID=A0AAV4CA25_9GAST|nr:hypothetical protein PoB_005491200 [Plakobranchus ocellatus]
MRKNFFRYIISPNYLIMPYAKNNRDPTPGSPMLGLSVGPTLLMVSPQQVISGFQALREGFEPAIEDPCRSQDGLLIHYATDFPRRRRIN